MLFILEVMIIIELKINNHFLTVSELYVEKVNHLLVLNYNTLYYFLNNFFNSQEAQIFLGNYKIDYKSAYIINLLDYESISNQLILKKGTILYDYLIIATGRKGNMLGLDNEKELIGKGVSLCALCDGFFYKDKEVIVVGGGNTALTDALYLSSLCKKVTIVHRRDSFTSFKYLIDRVSNTKNIDFLFNSTLTSYNIDDKKILKSVCINDKEVTTDGVFLAIGSTPNGGLFDVNKENGYIIVDSKYNTSVNNVYAIGDVIKKDIYQLVTASYDAVEASYDIIRKESEKLDNYE